VETRVKCVIRSWCNSCCRETDHEVTHIDELSSFEAPDHAVEEKSVVVSCRGCKDVSIRKETWYFDLVPHEENEGGQLTGVIFSPPRLWRRPPNWLPRLEPAEPDLCDILNEIYLATHDGQVRLLATGVRTALDYVMTQIIGDVGDFPAKLREMVAHGHLSSKQKDMLDTVIDAASATAHRGFKPDRALLEEMVDTMETVIRDHYLTGPSLRVMKTLVPPRPPRVPKS
jgi:hypothetical protein